MTWGPRLPWAPWHRALGASLTWASSSGAWLASLATGSQQRVLFYRHLEKGCQPPGLMSAGMWVLFLGSISYFPGWHDSLARHWDGCWKTPKTHLHQMRGRASAFETGPMWFSYRARYAVPSQQTHVKRKKKKHKMRKNCFKSLRGELLQTDQSFFTAEYLNWVGMLWIWKMFDMNYVLPRFTFPVSSLKWRGC